MRTNIGLGLVWIVIIVCVVWAGAGQEAWAGSLAEHSESSVQLPQGVSANWWATVQKDIRRSEYHITWQDRTSLPDVPAAYQAPNRVQNLRIYFTRAGIRVIPRTETTPGWQWGLSLTGYGYAGDVKPVAAADLSASANRIEYRRGALTEWYVNDEHGLGQGFTLRAPPEPKVSDHQSQIVLEIAFSGSLTPRLSGAGDAVEFATPDGVSVLRYGEMHGRDATGRELPARFAVNDGHVTIVVDTTSAVYPIAIDPVITAMSSPADWTAESDQADANFGISVGTAGDVNGDGYADVIVGAHYYDNGEADEGRAFVYRGSATGLSTTANWTAESDQAEAWFGYSAGTAGDVNGDGYADVIVGAFYYDNGEVNEGRAFVYHGSATGLSTTADWTAESDQVNAIFGWSAGTAGDVNGDGYADVIVGAPNYDSPSSAEGRAFVYHGSATGLSATADWTAESNQAHALLGASVGTAGDVNGDGYADVIAGAPGYDNPEDLEGRAFVYHGSAMGLSTMADWTAESDQAGAEFGYRVGTAGDVNGDGYADVIVGAYAYDNPEASEGRAYVYYGNGGAGLSLDPRQRKSDDSGPIAHLSMSDSRTSFRLALLGRTPFGRGKVKLEWEVKPLGTLFDGTGTQQSAAWMDTGTAGAQANELVSGLSPDTVYHWRVRLRYHPASTPLQQYSRWLTMPWDGWQEADLRTMQEKTLTTSSGAGGSVTTPGEGQFQYVRGAVASIAATADANYRFVNWTGTGIDAGKVANPNSASTTITMDADYSVVANFALDQRTLTASSTSGGSVTTPGEGSFQYNPGTVAAIVATPAANYHFVNWMGTGVTAGKVANPNSASTTITMDAAYTVVANFAIDQRTLTTSSTAGGSVTYPGEGSLDYGHGTVAFIVATPDANHHFVNWTGTGVTAGKVADPNSPSTTITMDADYTVVANFAIDQRILTTSSTAGGSVTTPGEGSFNYDHDTAAPIVATPDACYQFANWTGIGVDAGKVADPNSASTTITMDADYAVQANFEILDADEDGLPDCWEQQIIDDDPFDDIETIEDVLPGDDYDEDGMSNGDEYQSGTDPTDPNSVFELTNIERTSGSFTITISWSSVHGKSYAVYYSDSPFGGSMTWTLAEDVIAGSFTGTNTWVDDGTLTGSAPDEVPYRYYKVKVYGDNGYAFAKDIVGCYWKSIGVGRNLVSIPFVPFDTSLDSVIEDQLTGNAANKFFSDNIEKWDPVASNYQRAWYDTSSWVDWDTGGAPAFDWEADVGYWINIMVFNPPKNICFVGKVSSTSRSIPISQDRNLCGSAYPFEVHSLYYSGLLGSGFTGSAINFFSDNIEWWNSGIGNYDRVWYDTSASQWKNWDGSVAAKSFVPCDGFWINVLVFNPPFTWTYPKPYVEPPNN